jgi:hypothetical protein
LRKIVGKLERKKELVTAVQSSARTLGLAAKPLRSSAGWMAAKELLLRRGGNNFRKVLL